jgi:hypothetical protein
MPLGVTVGRTLNRVAGIVSAGALITFAAAPAAFAQETDTTAPSTTETTATSETTTTTAPTTSETTTAPSTSVTTTGTTTAPSTTGTTTVPETTPSTSATTTPPDDNFPDNTGHGFVGLGGEGILVINCAAGAPGGVATQYLDVTGGPDQDESDGRIWNYSVRVDGLPAGTTTGKFSWTCAGVDGEGVVDFEQAPPPESSTTNPPTTTTNPPTTTTSAPASSTAPITTSSAPSTSTTTTTPGNAAPKAQVKVAPKGGVETGFGGTAW